MEAKKTPKANLENYRATFFLIGLVFALTVTIGVFSTSKANVKIEDLQGNSNSNVEVEQVEVTRQDITPPPPPPPQQQVADVIEIVNNDVKLEDNFDFDLEADDNTEVDFSDVDFSDDDEVVEEEEPLVYAEQMPEFIAGGEAGLRQYIAEHIEYPELAQENDIQGTVYIRFVVTKTGTIGDVQVVRGVDPLLDEEAVRVVKSLPKFKPGMQGGRPVPVWFSVPIVFQLNN